MMRSYGNRVDMPFFIRKIFTKFSNMLNMVTIKKIDRQHYLYIIPKVRNIEDICKIARKNKNSKIILSKNLKIYEKQLEAKTGTKKDKYYMKYFINKILLFLAEKLDIKLELKNLYILVNEYNQRNLNIICDIINRVKTVTIITENITNYKKLEERLYREKGLLVSITNNKKKSLSKAELIINIDFKNEEINKYRINRNSIILNCSNELIKMIYFQGIVINDIIIHINKDNEYDYLYEHFDSMDVYKSFNLANNINSLILDNIQIDKLIGNNGVINEKELIMYQKNIEKYLDK